jgi:hypothetical protein
MKKLITILILISIVSLSILIISSSYGYKISNTTLIYEIVDDHIENNSKQTFGG